VGAVAQTPPTEATTPSEGPTRLTGRDAFWLHLTLTAGLLLCAGAFAFELARALGGHTFSWLYVFEWPLFAGFALYMWWHLWHGTDRTPRAPRQQATVDGSAPVVPGAPDEDLEAWNRYLRQMEADEAAQADDDR
jgi:hypothetical protein